MQYVHDGEDAALGLGSLSDSIPDFVPQVANAMIARLDLTLAGKALQKRTVDAMEGHPMEMALHGPGVAGGKEMDGVARGGGETGRGVELVGAVVGGVGPEIGVGAAAAGDGVVEPVEPAVVTCAV